MCESFQLVKQGAEAKLYTCYYLGKPAVMKERFRKTYRHVYLDVAISKERIKNEAKAIVRSKAADVRTPTLYLVDFGRRRIYMERFEPSITVKDFILSIYKPENDEDESIINWIATKIGQTVRKLHDNNINHGDLTTSNMMLIQKDDEHTADDSSWLDLENIEFAMIDFGLAHINSSPEKKGVDLYVLERALISTHNEYPNFFGKILEAYKNYSTGNVKDIIHKFEDVRARGRKRTMVG